MARNGKNKVWVLRECENTPTAEINALARELELSSVTTRLLYHRGYRTAEAVRRFLRASDAQFHSPFLLRDVDRAVARIRRAVEQGEHIVIYGDYDVDGVTSVTLLYLYLTELGATVNYYIPSRTGEGYGLSVAAIDKLADMGVTCIITVDTGITACEETAYAKSRGIDMVITDHHECRAVLPDAAAVVNPHRPDCPYPFKELAGVGVVFKLVSAYECTIGAEQGEAEIEGVRRVAKRFADLVAIGTIADVMPIVDENRLIVTYGLSMVENTERPGLAALVAHATNKEGASRPARRRKVTSGFIGFGIAPRINAAGRMKEATLAVDLLLSTDPARADELAAELCEINRARQAEENSIAEAAYAEIEASFDPDNTRVLVLGNDHWRQGVIGIVSSRVTERYGLPSILISCEGEDENDPAALGKGSGRSVKGMNLVEALTACEDLLVKFGGHELAAGLTVRRDQLDAFRRRINDYARACLPDGGVAAHLEADLKIELHQINVPVLEELSRLEPFGIGNPEPHFILGDVILTSVTEIGAGKHLRLTVSDGASNLVVMLFNTTRDEFPHHTGDHLDLLGTLSINEFRDSRTAQMLLQDYRSAANAGEKREALLDRYREVRGGGAFTREEDFLPERDDFAHVYTILRREFRQGRDTFTLQALLAMVSANAPHPINYVKLRYIVEVFHELRICGVEDLGNDTYRFDVFFNASKTSIDKSAILRRLRSQMDR